MVSFPWPETEVTEIFPRREGTSTPLWYQLIVGCGTPLATHVQLAVSPSAKMCNDRGAVINLGETEE
jgi:hypothetical protein